METFHYAGFLSYAHADEAIAARLHKTLERFRIPRGLKRPDTMVGLSPIFRDSEELSAHHSLTEKITSAVDSSRFLIVLCSPAAKTSHWVNEEIRLFRERRGDAFIISALTEGTPETAFPPALTEGGREPLAANLTPESFHQGVSQIAAAMLGVGLDDLVQRAAKRKTRRLQLAMAASFALTALMGGMTYLAYDARNAAEDSRSQAEASQARAETSRGQAEELVQFMVTDLREQLTAKERLSVLASIGERVTDYYDAQDTDRLPDTSLVRQAKAREVLGQVAIDMNELDKAQTQIDAAAQLSKQVLDRNPNSADAIFAHAQSVYWQGSLSSKRRNGAEARKAFEVYAELGQRLYDKDPKNLRWIMERGWGANNLAFLDRADRDYISAQARYTESIKFFQEAVAIAPQSRAAERELSNAIAGAAGVSLFQGRIEEARAYRKAQNEYLSRISTARPNDLDIAYRLSQARMQAYLIEIQIDPSACDIGIIDSHIEAFSVLLTYDKANARWRTGALMKLADELSVCTPHLSSDQILPRIEGYMEMLKEGVTSAHLDPHTKRLKTIRHILRGELNKAGAKLNAETLSQDVNTDAKDEAILIAANAQNIAYYYGVLGHSEKAASILGGHTAPVSYEPLSVRRAANALKSAGQCAAASELLKQRGMTDPAPQSVFKLCP